MSLLNVNINNSKQHQNIINKVLRGDCIDEQSALQEKEIIKLKRTMNRQRKTTWRTGYLLPRACDLDIRAKSQKDLAASGRDEFKIK